MGKRFEENGNEFCVFDDVTLDQYIEVLDIISANPDWIFLEALANFHDSFVICDCNELTYKLYCYAKENGIPYEIRNIPKWQKIYGIKTEDERIYAGCPCSPILISEETRRKGGTGLRAPYLNACFAFLNTIYKVNILSACLGRDTLFAKLGQAGISVERFPLETSCATWLDLRMVMEDDKVADFLNVARRTLSRKIAGILCNCQGEILFRMLREQKVFLKEYFVILLPPLYYIKEKSIPCIGKDIFGELDLFIYQFVKTTFYQPFFATENIISFLKPSCRRICIPDLYWGGYFPQIGHINKPEGAVLIRDANGDTLFQVRDGFIEDVYARTKSIGKTIEILLGEESAYFDRGLIEQNWNDAVERMLRAEESTDLKMSDYIVDNMKKRRLFVAPHNPVNELMYMEVKRLMEMLGLCFEPFDYDKNMPNFEGAQTVIYPYVRKTLELDFSVDEYYANKSFVDRKYQIEEYIELYIRNICKMV